MAPGWSRPWAPGAAGVRYNVPVEEVLGEARSGRWRTDERFRPRRTPSRRPLALTPSGVDAATGRVRQRCRSRPEDTAGGDGSPAAAVHAGRRASAAAVRARRPACLTTQRVTPRLRHNARLTVPQRRRPTACCNLGGTRDEDKAILEFLEEAPRREQLFGLTQYMDRVQKAPCRCLFLAPLERTHSETCYYEYGRIPGICSVSLANDRQHGRRT